jgi:3-oxoacyl-[acyl-carrier protein] reductase
VKKKYCCLFLLLCFFLGACLVNHLEAKERKTLVLTGASGELGTASARVLAPDYDLILTGRDLSKLKKLQEELNRSHSGRYEVCLLDFISRSSREDFYHYVKQLNAPIGGIVLITPRPQFHGKALMQNENVWLEVFQSTFTGPTEALQEMIPYLSSPSKIVVIAGTTSVQFQSEYGPSCVIRRMWTTYTRNRHQCAFSRRCLNKLSRRKNSKESSRSRTQL